MTNKSKNYQIACIPADGIGPEVISAAVDVLKVLTDTLKTFSLEFTDLTWGSDHYKKHGRYIPEGGVESLKQYDAILFGSVGAPGTHPLSITSVHLFLTGLLQMYLITYHYGDYCSLCEVLCSYMPTYDLSGPFLAQEPT